MDYNPLSPESRANPYPGYALLRKEAPVHEMQPFGVFAVSRHEDVQHVLKTPEVFSSAGMRAMMTGQTGMMGSGQRSSALTDSNSVISSDPPIHDRLRAVVNRGSVRAQSADAVNGAVQGAATLWRRLWRLRRRRRWRRR